MENTINKYWIWVLLAVSISSGCGDDSSKTKSKEPQDCMASTQEELEVCYKDKSISDLASIYCNWAKLEADSKDQNDNKTKGEADNHTDAIQKVVRGREATQKDEFRELTKGCKEYN